MLVQLFLDTKVGFISRMDSADVLSTRVELGRGFGIQCILSSIQNHYSNAESELVALHVLSYLAQDRGSFF